MNCKPPIGGSLSVRKSARRLRATLRRPVAEIPILEPADQQKAQNNTIATGNAGHRLAILRGAAPWRSAPAGHARHEAVLAFVGELGKREAVAALALEFAVLTAARAREVIGAKRDEVDLDKAIWTIAANRMKVGKEYRVPLGILSTHQQLGSECFPRRSGAGKNQVCGHAAPPFVFGVTVHGFRSRFRNRAADCTGCAHEVAKMALAQTSENKLERAYRRGDLFHKQRWLMDDWAVYCCSRGGWRQRAPIRAHRST